MCSFNVYAEELEDVVKGKLGGATDGNINTEYTIRNSTSPVQIDLTTNYDLKKIALQLKNVSANSSELSVSFLSVDQKVLYSTSFSVKYASKLQDFTRDVNVSGVRYIELSGTAKIFDFQLFGEKYFPSISDLTYVEGVNNVDFNWKNPSDASYKGLKVFVDNNYVSTVDFSENVYSVKSLDANKHYSFKFISLYESNGEILESKVINKTVKTLVDPKTIPPGPVSSFVADPTDKTVKLKWKSPKDDDLAGFKILQNGKQIAEIGLEEEFTVKNLKPLTDYNFGVIAVDKDKNDSSPVNLSVKTLEEKDEEPPHVPANVFAKPSNGALIASWDKVSDKDLAGYNVYVDDKKINSNLISSTNFTIKNLENNRKYKIQVQAVDRSGNFSELSLAAYGIPDERTIPIIESKYSLQDISDGVNVMFGQFWLVLAFAVGIPLSFYIIYKLKLTVLP